MSVELTHHQAVNREKDIQEELERLKAKTEKTAEDKARVAPLLEEFRQVHAHRLDLEHDMALDEIRSAATAPAGAAQDEDRPQIVDGPARGVNFSAGKYKNPWDTTEVRYGRGAESEMRSRAFDAIERMPHASDSVREASTKFVERDAALADMVLATTSPQYADVFTKLVRSKGNAGVLSSEEHAIYVRAMSTTDSAGGFAIPFQLDPSVILTADGSVNQVRQISRVVQATGDTWNGVSSAGVTASWDAEATQVSDDAPTLAQPSIPVYKLQVFVPLSHEVQMDAPTLANDIAQMIAFEKDAKESTAFVTGSGSGQPTGIVTALTGGSQVVNSATTDTFAVADVYNLDGALPQRYAANASWLAHRKIYNLMRRFDTNGGAALWGYLADGRKPELLGRPDYVSEAMTSSITALADNLIAVYGDFSNFVVVDRLGVSLSYIPHLFGANGRPTGQGGWHAWLRVGSDSVNDAAFRILNCT